MAEQDTLASVLEQLQQHARERDDALQAIGVAAGDYPHLPVLEELRRLRSRQLLQGVLQRLRQGGHILPRRLREQPPRLFRQLLGQDGQPLQRRVGNALGVHAQLARTDLQEMARQHGDVRLVHRLASPSGSPGSLQCSHDPPLNWSKTVQCPSPAESDRSSLSPPPEPGPTRPGRQPPADGGVPAAPAALAQRSARARLPNSPPPPMPLSPRNAAAAARFQCRAGAPTGSLTSGTQRTPSA